MSHLATLLDTPVLFAATFSASAALTCSMLATSSSGLSRRTVLLHALLNLSQGRHIHCELSGALLVQLQGSDKLTGDHRTTEGIP